MAEPLTPDPIAAVHCGCVVGTGRLCEVGLRLRQARMDAYNAVLNLEYRPRPHFTTEVIAAEAAVVEATRELHRHLAIANEAGDTITEERRRRLHPPVGQEA